MFESLTNRLTSVFSDLARRGRLTEKDIDETLREVRLALLQADVDFNVVMTDKSEFVEVQGTAEEGYFSKDQLDQIMHLAEKGLRELFKVQQEVIGTL